jgi:hypothetical protein
MSSMPISPLTNSDTPFSLCRAEFAVDMAFAQVGVDDDHALAGLGQHRAQVLGDEALADALAGAGDEQGALGGIQQGEMDGGAQAAQALHRVVIGLAQGQQLALGLAGLEQAGQGDFRLAVGNGGVDRQPQLLLDLFRVFHHDPERTPQPDDDEAEGQAQQQGDAEHACGIGRNPVVFQHRLVDDAGIADGAGLGHAQLLGGVEQFGVELAGDFQVSLQAQDGLLGVRQAGYLGAELATLGFQALQLGVHGLDGGVVGVKRWRSSSRSCCSFTASLSTSTREDSTLWVSRVRSTEPRLWR